MLEPRTFDEAYYHNPEQHDKWHAAIRKEFKDMNNHGVLCKIKQSVILQGQVASSLHGYLELKGMVCFKPDW